MGVKKYFGEKPTNGPTPFKAQFGDNYYDIEVIEDCDKPSFYPSPSVLAEYEEIKEGSADRILALVENEQRKSAHSASEALKLHNAHIKRGQLIFASLTVLIVAATLILSFSGFILPAAALGLGGMLIISSLIFKYKKESVVTNKKNFVKKQMPNISSNKPNNKSRRNRRPRRR